MGPVLWEKLSGENEKEVKVFMTSINIPQIAKINQALVICW